MASESDEERAAASYDHGMEQYSQGTEEYEYEGGGGAHVYEYYPNTEEDEEEEEGRGEDLLCCSTPLTQSTCSVDSDRPNSRASWNRATLQGSTPRTGTHDRLSNTTPPGSVYTPDAHRHPTLAAQPAPHAAHRLPRTPALNHTPPPASRHRPPTPPTPSSWHTPNPRAHPSAQPAPYTPAPVVSTRRPVSSPALFAPRPPSAAPAAALTPPGVRPPPGAAAGGGGRAQQRAQHKLEVAASHLLAMLNTVERMRRLKEFMQGNVCFDVDDAERVTQALHAAREKARAIQEAVAGEELPLLHAFLTLQQREKAFELAIQKDMLCAQEDAELLRAFVKKQVYLRNIMNDM